MLYNYRRIMYTSPKKVAGKFGTFWYEHRVLLWQVNSLWFQSATKASDIYLSNRSSDHPFVKCNTEEIYGDLYPYFDWVQYAEYDGSRTMGEEPIEFWKIEVKLRLLARFTKFCGN